MKDKSNNQILRIYNLPVLNSVDDFSKYVRLSKDTIYRLSKYSFYFYRTFEVDKKNGGKRLIAEPSKMLKGIQAWVLVNILNKLSPSSNSTGFRKGYSLLNNAMPHIGAVEILNMDIEDFFGSTKSNKVFRLFRSIGYNKVISNILTKLCCFKGRLPQGAPSSPVLANLTNIRLDTRLSKYCANNSIIYTRYADDMTFSIPILNFSKHVRKVVKTIIEDEGYIINERKTRIQGLSSRKKVTGLILTDNSVGIGRKKYRLLRSKLFNLCKNKSLNTEEVNMLKGWLAYLHSVDKNRCKQFYKYIEKLSIRFNEEKLKSLLI